jgi:hypothetical protein
MKTFAAFFCALFVAGSTFADPYSIAKQQAKNVVASENKNQQAINSSDATPAPVTPPQNNSNPNPPPNPALQATLQNIAGLRADFENLVSGPANATNVASSQPLINDLTAASQSIKPSPASVSKLARDLTAVLAGNDKLRSQQQKLASWVHAVFNSSHLSTAQSQMIHDGVQKIFADAGVPVPDAANVINDLQTIATETR